MIKLNRNSPTLFVDIKANRLLAGLSNKQLGDEIGIHERRVSAWQASRFASTAAVPKQVWVNRMNKVFAKYVPSTTTPTLQSASDAQLMQELQRRLATR